MAAMSDLLKRAFDAAFYGRYSSSSQTLQNDEVCERQSEKILTMNEHKLTNILGPFESYVVNAQSILIWERPMISCIVLLLVNLSFWLFVNSDIKFYFVLASSMALIHVYRTWTKQIWPEIRVPTPAGEDTEEWTPVNPQVYSVPEISRFIGEMSETVKQWTSWLIKTRQKQPGTFCILASCTLAIIGFIGCYITGVFQAYLIIMTVMLGPGFIVHIYPMISHLFNLDADHIIDSDEDDDCKQHPLIPIYGDTENQELEQFIPESNQETMDILTKAAELPLAGSTSSSGISNSLELCFNFMTSTNDDEELISLQAGLTDLPSYDRIDSDDDDQDFVDGNGSMPATLPPPIKCKSESPEIRFVPSYFDDDSEDTIQLYHSPGTSTEQPIMSRQSSTSPSDIDAVSSDYEVLCESELS